MAKPAKIQCQVIPKNPATNLLVFLQQAINRMPNRFLGPSQRGGWPQRLLDYTRQDDPPGEDTRRFEYFVKNRQGGALLHPPKLSS